MKKILILAIASALALAVTAPCLHAALPPNLRHSQTATASSGAATLNTSSGIITSEALTTAGLAAYTLTITNDHVFATGLVYCVVWNGTNTQGTPAVGIITPAAGSVVIKIYNLHATQALNGTIKVGFSIL
jgi:hypothetical protein